MRSIDGEISGPTIVRQDTRLNGSVRGDVTVPPGVHLELNGTIRGNLLACKGSRTVIHGVVLGRIFDEGGQVEVYGLVGRQRASDARDAYLHPTAILHPRGCAGSS